MIYNKSITLLLSYLTTVNKIYTKFQHSENAESEFSCELLLSYLAKEIAKEYVKRLENSQLIEPEDNLEEKE